MRGLMIFAFLFATGLSAGITAQGIDRNTSNVFGVKIEIAEQADCPLKLSLEKPPSGDGTFSIKLLNTSEKPIRGYVLLIDSDERNEVYITVRAGGAIGAETAAFEPARGLRSESLTWKVDYIRFADGTSWGDDGSGRSKYISAFLSGRDTALARLKDLSGGTIPGDIQKTLDGYYSHSTGENVRAKVPDALKSQTLFGYRSIISLLRSPRAGVEANDLAQKLELTEGGLL